MTQLALFQPGQRVRLGPHRGRDVTATVVSVQTRAVKLEDVRWGEEPWEGPMMARHADIREVLG